MSRLRAMFRPLAARPVWGAVAFASLTLILLWAFVPQVAQAGSALENVLIQVVGALVKSFVYILGTILIKFIAILVTVAQFNNFIDAPAVKIGWSVTRDMANMFFIVALLLIAIGTMFRIDQYRYSRTLQKLILMAILINFSKAIAGFFIDFSQVVMLTFVNAFKDQAAGSLSAGFGIDKLLTISSNVSAAGGDIETLSVLGSLFAALIMVFVATVIVAIFTILLIQRIIMLWIYIVLAPTAYMVAVLPGSLGSWWSTWWRDFSQYLIKGPVIAFFLWLALTVITLSTSTLVVPSTSTLEPNMENPAFVNDATTGTAIINYLVAIGMLIAGLQQAVKAGGAAGAVAGKWMGNFNKWGSAIATSPISAAKGIGKATLTRPAYGIAGGALSVASKIPLVGGFARNANAKLRKSRVRMEEKDSDLVNYMSLDEKMRTLNSVSNPFSMKAIGQKRNIRENILKSADFGKLGSEDRQKLHDDAQRSAGLSWYTNSDGSRKAIYKDNALGKAVEDAENNDPTLLAGAYSKAIGGGDIAAQTYYKKRIEKAATSASPENIAKWNTDLVDPTHAKYNADMADLVFTAFNKRNQDPTSRFVQQMRLNALGTQGALDRGYAAWTAPVGTTKRVDAAGSPTLFQEDIDRERQERTARRMADYQQRGLKFHESDEYLKNSGQFYDLKSFDVNTAQEERRIERENLKKHGVSLPVIGASSFASGAEDTLAVSNDLLESEGIKLGAGGTVISDEDKLKLASALDTKLTQDIADVERDLVNVAPEILDRVQDGSGTGTTVREALQTKIANLKGVQSRIQDVDKLGSISFVNADRYGGNARNILAEEGFHQQLQEMDKDGSFRKELWNSMAPEERQQIVQQMRDKTKRQDLGEDEAFDEYLAKGLTNLTRETWADTGPDAVKLKSGFALEVQRQAEAQGVKMWKLDKLGANVNIPARVSSTVAGAQAVARGVSGAVMGTAQTVGQAATAPIRAAQRYSAQRAGAKAEKSRAEIPDSQLNLRVTEDMLKNKRKALTDFERQTQTDTNTWNQQYQEEEQTMKTTTNALVARKSAEKMKGLRTQIVDRNKELKERRESVQADERGLTIAKQNLAKKVSGAYGGTPKVESRPSAGASQAPTVAPKSEVTPLPSPPPTGGRGNAPAPTGAAANATAMSAAAGAEPSAPRTGTEPVETNTANQEAGSNVTNHITNNITEVINSMSTPNRDNMLKLTGKNLDEAFVNSVHMLGLKGMLESTLKEIQNSKKLTEISNTELVKRFTAAQKHADEGTPEAKDSLKQEIKKIQSLLGGNS